MYRVRSRARGGRPPVAARGGPRAFVLLLEQRERRCTVHVVVGRPGRGARRGTAGRERALVRAVAPSRGGNVRAFADARGVPSPSPLALGVRVHHARLVIVVDVVLLHRVARAAQRRWSARPPALRARDPSTRGRRRTNPRTTFQKSRDSRNGVPYVLDTRTGRTRNARSKRRFFLYVAKESHRSYAPPRPRARRRRGPTRLLTTTHSASSEGIRAMSVEMISVLTIRPSGSVRRTTSRETRDAVVSVFE